MSKSRRRISSLLGLCLVLGSGLFVQSRVSAESPPKVAPKPVAPLPKPVTPAPTPTGPTCKLDEEEIPRGGRLDVSGERFGQAPVVRIAGKPARILERREDRISVQVAADSNGGAVTVSADGKTAECGTLTIIGKNRE